jgi:hypothetical protein
MLTTVIYHDTRLGRGLRAAEPKQLRTYLERLRVNIAAAP